MAHETPSPGTTPALRGLLITGDPALVRAFRRELEQCADCSISFEAQSNLDEARRGGSAHYDCVTIDLDGSIVADVAVRLAREAWPNAGIAVLSCWWSERESLANERADVVIHKPLRAAELRAFLRSPTGAPAADEVDAVDQPASVRR